MDLLLDTHVWLWSLLDPERLSTKANDLILAQDAALHLSAISVWETLLLVERGRVLVATDGESWVEKAIAQSPLKEVPITFDVAIASRLIDLPHNDPADRFIAASAQVLDFTLVTADQRLLSCRQVQTVSARTA